MTTYNKTTLKTYFETNDVPAGTDYANLIDSNVNLVETAEQAMAGPLSATEFIAPKVSAASLTVSGTMSAARINVTGDVSAVSGTVYASALRTNYLFAPTPTIVSATGTTQATGALISAYITRGQGSTDGSATGFLLPSPSVGLIQYFVHEGAVSANLWPNSGCSINALAGNAAFALAANTTYTIIHKATSAYAVK